MAPIVTAFAQGNTPRQPMTHWPPDRHGQTSRSTQRFAHLVPGDETLNGGGELEAPTRAFRLRTVTPPEGLPFHQTIRLTRTPNSL